MFCFCYGVAFFAFEMLIESLSSRRHKKLCVEVEVTETGTPETFVELLFPSRGTRSLLRGKN